MVAQVHSLEPRVCQFVILALKCIRISLLMKIALITPAAANSRYGNRNTALRWAQLLRELGHQVHVQQQWNGRGADLLLALHARRSHESIARFAERYPERPLILALTGTDLYRDIHSDVNAQESMELATRMVVLQDMGLRELAPSLRRKTHVIYQSCEAIPRQPPIKSCYEIVISGHLREEKDPFCGAAALKYLPADSRIRITHIGGARDPALAAEARLWMKREPRYVWLGELARPQALATLARARAMLLSSLMEGGANVISEALMARVPVIASKISGNIGMLGRAYRGYFPVSDARALAKLLVNIETRTEFLAALSAQCAVRRKLISVTQEKRGLRTLLAGL
jgi:putative glycosyltransferase (TIGR04348 family)